MIRKCRVVVFFALIAASSGVTWAGDGGFNGLPLGIDLPNPADGSETGNVRIADDDALEPQRFTIEAWIQPLGPGFGHEPVIISKPMEGHAGIYISSWMIVWRPTDEVMWVFLANILNTNNQGINFLGVNSVPSGTSSHVAVTFDGAYLRLFINGVEDGASPVETGFDTVDYGPQDVLIGAGNFSNPYERRFDGIIDEVRIWDHARSEAEIAGQMNCALDGTEPGLLAYYSFNMGDARDDSDQGHDGVIEGEADFEDFSQDCMILFDGFDDGTTGGWD